MILELPEAASAKRRLELAATNWDPDRGGQLLGEPVAGRKCLLIHILSLGPKPELDLTPAR